MSDRDEEMLDYDSEGVGNNRGGSAKGASAPSDRKGSSARPAQLLQLVAAFESDAAIQSLRSRLRESLRPAVESLHTAIHSEMVAHTLLLYRYTRLQRKLMEAKEWTRLRAARKLNSWMEAAYGEHGQELIERIKREAHRLFDLFSEPADDDEWWPELFAGMVKDGSRTKHLLEALLLLNRYHEPIQRFYQDEAAGLELMELYLHTNKWTARQIEQDLIDDGVIKQRKKKKGDSTAVDASPGAAAAAAAGEAEETDDAEEGTPACAHAHQQLRGKGT